MLHDWQLVVVERMTTFIDTYKSTIYCARTLPGLDPAPNGLIYWRELAYNWQCKRCGTILSCGKVVSPESLYSLSFTRKDCNEQILHKVLDP